MKTAVKAVTMVVVGLALIITAGCSSTPKYSGFLGSYENNLQPGPEGKYSGFLGSYENNLQPGPEGGAKMRWLKPEPKCAGSNPESISPSTISS